MLPQVLNLPPQSLQQEIELTEDLMELFIQHQIPSDLLMATPDTHTTTHTTSDGDSSSNSSGAGAGVEKVRANVLAIQVSCGRVICCDVSCCVLCYNDDVLYRDVL